MWWQTLDSNQNALVGYETGSIALISLTDGRFLGSCSISEPVRELYLCQDKEIKAASLLVSFTKAQHCFVLIIVFFFIHFVMLSYYKTAIPIFLIYIIAKTVN